MNERPVIAHVVPALFGDDGIIGGAERYALELAQAMSRRVRTILIAFGGKPRAERRGDLEIHVLRNWVNYRRFRFDPVNFSLVGALRHADVIHYHQTHTMMSTVALLYARLFRKPIFTSHLGGNGIALHHYVNIDSWYAGHLHISEFSRRHFRHENLANARVILGGVDVDRFSPDERVARTNEVVYVGRILPHKGIDDLIKGIGATVPLVIIGRRWRHAAGYFDHCRGLAQGKNVRFIEDADDARIISAYRRAACVVLPSVHQACDGGYYPIPELLGQTLLEGMACGAPGVCTNVASLPEIVADGVTGLVAAPNNPDDLGGKIHWLLDHAAERLQMGRAARNTICERFTWDAVVDRCLSAYKEALCPVPKRAACATL